MECVKCSFQLSPSDKTCPCCNTPRVTGEDLGASLCHFNDLGEEVVIPVCKAEFIVGRSHECDLVVPHASISRQHAVIRFQSGQFLLADLNSKNGVQVNNRRALDPTPLNDGDVVQFGDVSYTFSRSKKWLNLKTVTTTEARESGTVLGTLLEVSKLINSSLVLSEVLEKVMDSVMKLTRAQRGLLMITDADGNLELKVARNIEATDLANNQFPISMSTVQRVFKSGRAFVTVDVENDSQVNAQQSIINLGLKTIMCVPLKHRGLVRGLIYVDSHNVTRGFADADLKTMEVLADHAAIAIENARLTEENKEMFLSTIGALAEAIEKRDPYTGGHTRRVLEFCLEISDEMKLSPADKETLRLAALLHDIGKIGIDDQVLRKITALTEEEFNLIRQHPGIGRDIIKHIRKLEDVIPGILMHHERVDGKGYPLGCAGDKIPLIARIIAVADAFDAMVSDRPYRKGLQLEMALAELERVKGKQFDPDVVEAFERALENRTTRQDSGVAAFSISTLTLE